jgi:hypothetical protein
MKKGKKAAALGTSGKWLKVRDDTPVFFTLFEEEKIATPDTRALGEPPRVDCIFFEGPKICFLGRKNFFCAS